MITKMVIRFSVFGVMFYGVSQCFFTASQPQLAHLQYEQHIAEVNAQPTLDDKIAAVVRQVDDMPIPDSVLRDCIKTAVRMYTGAIFRDEMTAPTQIDKLQCYRGKVSDVTGLERFTRLRTLDLSYSSVVNIEPLAKLHALESLNLSQTKVRSLASLAELPKLTELRLRSVTLDNVMDFAYLPALTTVEYTIGNNYRCSDLDNLFGNLHYRSLTLNFPAQCIDFYGSTARYIPSY